jgi:hypothetical protein
VAFVFGVMEIRRTCASCRGWEGRIEQYFTQTDVFEMATAMAEAFDPMPWGKCPIVTRVMAYLSAATRVSGMYFPSAQPKGY